jgi:predicted acyl esterase
LSGCGASDCGGCGSFSDNNLHSRGSFRGFERISSADRFLYTHRGGKWATFYSAEARAAQLRFFDRYLRGRDVPAPPRVRLEVRESRDVIASLREEGAWPLERISLRALDDRESRPFEPVPTFTRREPLAPGQIAQLDIALGPSATLLRAGETLRLVVAGRWLSPLNPLTGQFPAAYQKGPAGRCTLHWGPDHQARLLVPVIP